MIFLRSILLNLFIVLWTPLVGVPGTLLTLFDRKRGIVRVMALWARGIIWAARWLTGIRFRIEGAEHLPQGAYIVAAKHQSAWETIGALAMFDHPAIVLKKELLTIPVFGWYAKHGGMIPVDREGSASAMRTMMKAADAAKNAGRPIVIFPEGTRSAPGTQPELQPGLAGLYRHLGLPLVPIALNSGLVWGRSSFFKRPGLITVQVHPPVDPGLPRQDMMARVHAAINSLEGSPQ